MNLGWSDGGQGGLRAANSDRDEVRRLLRIGRDEGRLDDAEHERRAGAVLEAKTRADLVRLTADLPQRKGVREWADPLRVRAADRDDARGWLAEAAAQGRLADQEFARRSALLSIVETYADLRRLVDGLPGWSGTAPAGRLAGTADREAALAALAEAVADGRVTPPEAPGLEADIRQARRAGDLDTLLTGLAARVGERKRRGVLEALARAHQDGQLDVAEYAERAGRAHEAGSDADLGFLVADLSGGTRRLTEPDRREAAGTLRRGLDEGRLDLAEFDERVRAVHAATTTAEVAALVADLVAAPRPPRRGWTDAAFDRFVANSALMPASRHRAVRWAWKGSVAATLLAYVSVVALYPLQGVVGGWAPLALLLWLENSVAFEFAAELQREQAVLDGLRARLDGLRTLQPGIEEITLTYPVYRRDESEDRDKKVPGEAQVKVRFREYGEALHPEVREEIVKLMWLSRLYPLRRIELDDRPTSAFVSLKGEAARLRHRYGPRPYGPYREPAG